MSFQICIEIEINDGKLKKPEKVCHDIPVDLIGPEDFEFSPRHDLWYKRFIQLTESRLRRELTILAHLDSLTSRLSAAYQEKFKATIRDYFNQELSPRLPKEIKVKFE